MDAIQTLMSMADDRNNIRLEFEGLGPVLRGSVETRPLTVFIGPNGSGKSYTARLLYALFRKSSEEEQSIITSEDIKRMLEGTFGQSVNKLVNVTSDKLSVTISHSSSEYSFRMDRNGNIQTDPSVWNIRKFYMYYLPSSREGLLQLYIPMAIIGIRLLSETNLLARYSDLKEKLNLPEIELNLPYTITQLMETLLALSSPYRDVSINQEYSKEIDFLERNILKGSIYLKENRPLLHQIVYKQYEPELELSVISSASGVSELAPLALFLKYLKPKKMGYLIIEEPEAHLHPELQRQVARLLAMLVRSNVRVLVTTHSDILLDELNILLRLKGLSPEKRKELGYMDDEFLSPDQVGVYLFRREEREGYVTQELPVIEDEGVSEEELIQVAFEMGDTHAKISRMKDL